MPLEVSPAKAPLQVPLPRIATFVRQLTHDVRNNLNSLDLQAAYVAELTADKEILDELRRIRTLVQTAARQLQGLSANFQPVKLNLVSYNARIFLEDLQDRVRKVLPEEAKALQWECDVADTELSVDIEQIFAVVVELIRNAFAFREGEGSMKMRAYNGQDSFVLELQQPRSAGLEGAEAWGTEPFVSGRRGGYGLGLYRSREIVSAHSGELAFFYDSGSATLNSRVSLPLA